MKRGFERCKDGANSIEDHIVTPLSLAAGDALACMGYALLSMQSQEAEDAAWAGARSSDTFFQFITKYVLPAKGPLIKLDRATLDAASANHFYGEELARQSRDLDALQTINVANADEVALSIRSSNEKDGELVLTALMSVKSE